MKQLYSHTYVHHCVWANNNIVYKMDSITSIATFSIFSFTLTDVHKNNDISLSLLPIQTQRPQVLLLLQKSHSFPPHYCSTAQTKSLSFAGECCCETRSNKSLQ